MGDHMAKGEDMEKKAEKKINGWGLFGSKYEDAGDLYDKAANFYKLAKSWDKAGAVYIKLANCHLKLESKHEAASAFVDAANCYKKTSGQEAITCLNQAVNMFLEIGRLNMAARYCKEIGELYEAEQNFEQSINFFERAADLFQSEEVTTSANQCKQKVAQFAAQLEQYPKAVEIFEEIARQSMNNNLLKYSVKGILLNAGICQLCRGDVVAITNSLERYQELDPTFSGTREYKFLADLAASMDEEDVETFTNTIKEFDSMTRLDAWKTTLLLRVKNALKAKEEEEDDLT
ncbi:alpha-soluble NSF attachment protein [Cinnamomum micranthum f. kanehirae]|uniref:Alpha-soluble NSF attachment protein n=1 Tax=Cinnamomum micranthum f. kanehirae TaxID=337451 RepID=A0A443NKD6_9MAGN|nr:alpha-soluble NSF attachment protein [Cinnamomum micranthum f. kanehirae]